MALASAGAYLLVLDAQRTETARFEAAAGSRVRSAGRVVDRELQATRGSQSRDAELQRLLEALTAPGERLVVAAGDGRTIAAAGDPASADTKARFTHPLTGAEGFVALELPRPQPLARHGWLAAMHLAVLGMAALLVYLAARRVATLFTGDVGRIRRALVDARNGVFCACEAAPVIRETTDLLPDIASLAAALQESRGALTAESITDPLTGLYNRRYFDIMLTHAFEQSSRRPATYLVMLDLVGFRAVNKRHGRHTGDLLLEEVARFLREHVRRSDTAARLGDDRFALLLNNVLPDAMVPWLAELLEGFDAGVRRAELGDAGRIDSALAAGFAPVDVAVYATPDDAVRAADQALYRALQAKSRGSRLQPAAPRAQGHEEPAASSRARATR